MKYMKGYKLISIFAIFMKLIEAVFELILPLIMITLINNGYPNKDFNKTIILMLLLVFGGYVFTIICQYLATKVAFGVGGSVRNKLFEKILTFSLSDIDAFGKNSLTNRINVDSYQYQTMINLIIRLVSRAPILIVGSIVALYTLNKELALILLYALPLFVLVISLFMYISLQQNKRIQKSLDHLVNRCGEILSGMRVIRAFNKETFFFDRFKHNNDELAKFQKTANRINTLSTPFITLIMNGVMLVLVYVGALQINDKLMMNTDLLAVINYCSQLVLALIVVSNLVIILSKGYASYKRINEIMEHESIIKNEGSYLVNDKPMALTFKDVSFKYPNSERYILNNINMEINPGDKIGIIGLTGSGKSTLVQLIPRLYEIIKGELRINHKNIKSYDIHSLREHICFVSQLPLFIQGSLKDNIQMLDDSINVMSFVEKVGGQDLIDKSESYEILEKGMNLSGGQRQRLNIARSIVKKAGILILDDAINGLDNLSYAKVMNLIKEDYKYKTVIMVSQNTTTLQNMDRIYVIEEGRITQEGTHNELLETSKLYRELYELKMEDGL